MVFSNIPTNVLNQYISARYLIDKLSDNFTYTFLKLDIDEKDVGLSVNFVSQVNLARTTFTDVLEQLVWLTMSLQITKLHLFPQEFKEFDYLFY